MNKPPDETLKQGRNRSWLLKKCVILTNIKLFKRENIYTQVG
jgi:hypothetical protein